MNPSYKSTINACRVGSVNLAVTINLTAILFVPLREQFNLSYTQLGLLVLTNFAAMVSVAILFANIVDRYGFRRFIIGAHFMLVVGLIWFAATPWTAEVLPVDPYILLITGVLLFAAAGGFLELLCSPILNAIPIPEKEKSAAMSNLHAYFSLGQICVVLVTTLLLFYFGTEAWPFVALIWTIIPLLNGLRFIRCPMPSPLPKEKQAPARDVLKRPLFALLLLLIFSAGASEITMAQWTSAFMEEALELPKIVGDILGACMFAVMMFVGRYGYGRLGARGLKWSQHSIMLAGGVLTFVSYIVVAVTSVPALGLLACALCGLGVALLWPGTLSLAVDTFPKAGTWMFALLVAAGNSGSAASPSLFGVIADQAGLNMGFMITSVFPLGVIICLIVYRFTYSR